MHYLLLRGISYVDKFVLLNSELKLEEAAVLHYTYPKFSDLTSRRDRCGCKPTKEDVKRCFMLEFDRSVSLLPFHCTMYISLLPTPNNIYLLLFPNPDNGYLYLI